MERGKYKKTLKPWIVSLSCRKIYILKQFIFMTLDDFLKECEESTAELSQSCRDS